MSDQKAKTLKEAALNLQGLSRWDNEGGAEPDGPQATPPSRDERIAMPKMTDAELGELHIRIIGLENLVIALLATGSNQQIELAREMATYISPRPGFTQHPLTVHAATHMIDIVERASRFRDRKQS
jgi:hypothetical protein